MHRSLLLLLPSALFALDFPSTPPVEPRDAVKTFHVLDGFEMQLIAAEPLVTDPVAITYDADGRAQWQQRIDTIEARGLDAVADGTMQRWFSDAFRTAQAPTAISSTAASSTSAQSTRTMIG